jgi:transposase
VTATAREIAVLFYITLGYGMSYKDPGADHEQQYRNRLLVNLQRRAKSLGFVLQAFRGALIRLFFRKSIAILC